MCSTETGENLSLRIAHPIDSHQSIQVQTPGDATMEQLANQVAARLELKPGSIVFDRDQTCSTGIVEDLVDDGDTLVAYPREPNLIEPPSEPHHVGFCAPAAEADTYWENLNLSEGTLSPNSVEHTCSETEDVQTTKTVSDQGPGWGETSVIVEDPWEQPAPALISADSATWQRSDQQYPFVSQQYPLIQHRYPLVQQPGLGWVPPSNSYGYSNATAYPNSAVYANGAVYPNGAFYQQPAGAMHGVGYVLHVDPSTRNEVFQRCVCGAPASMIVDMMHYIQPGTRLFLWEPKAKRLLGPLFAGSRPLLGAEPFAFGGRFPAQVRFEYTNWFSTCHHVDKLHIGAVTAEHAFYLEQQLATAQRPMTNQPPMRSNTTHRTKYQSDMKCSVQIPEHLWPAVAGSPIIKKLSARLRTHGHSVHIRPLRDSCTFELKSCNEASLQLAAHTLRSVEQKMAELFVTSAELQGTGEQLEFTEVERDGAAMGSEITGAQPENDEVTVGTNIDEAALESEVSTESP